MQVYTTKIRAISPIDGELKTYVGPNVPGISFQTAQDYCDNNGLGYCRVDGMLISEISFSDNKCIDYETNLN
jgi:hypothetical protein